MILFLLSLFRVTSKLEAPVKLFFFSNEAFSAFLMLSYLILLSMIFFHIKRALKLNIEHWKTKKKVLYDRLQA